MRKLSVTMHWMLRYLHDHPFRRRRIIERTSTWDFGMNPTAKALLARGLIEKTGELTEAGKKVLEEKRDANAG